MADSIVRIRLDSSKFDNQLKRAGDALNKFFAEAKQGGNSIAQLDEESVALIGTLAQMETTAKNTKGQVREMTQVLTDLTMAYRNLSDEEKASAPGQEIAKSIQLLTERAGQAKDAMDDVSASIKNAASDTRTFDQLAGAANLAISGFQTLQGAAKLMGVEIGNDVEVIARLQAAMAVTNGLTQIQTVLQKESALMQGVMTVQTKAAAVAQSLLAKNTAMATAAGEAFNIVAKASPIGLLVTTIGAAVAAFGLFSSSTDDASEDLDSMAHHADLAADAIAKISDQVDFDVKIAEAVGRAKRSILELRLEAANAKVDAAKAAGERYNQEVEAYQSQAIGDMGNPLRPFARFLGIQKGVSKPSQEARDSIETILKDAVAERESIQKEFKVLNLSQMQISGFAANPQSIGTQREFEAVVAGVKDMLKDAGTAGNKRYDYLTGQLQRLLEYGKSVGFSSSPNSTPRPTGSRRGSATKSTSAIDEILPVGSVASLNKEIQSLKKAQDLVTDTKDWQLLQEQIDHLTYQIKVLKGEMSGAVLPSEVSVGPSGVSASLLTPAATTQTSWAQGLQGQASGMLAANISAQQQALQQVNASYKAPEKQTVKLSETMSSVAGGISSMVSGIENLGIELPKGLKDVLGGIQTVTSILSGIATVVTAIQAITLADAIIPFKALGGIVPHAASGYFVPGSRYSGDITPIMANAGELVLNKAQQGVLAASLESAEGGGAGGGQPYLMAEMIVLGTNNHLRRTGQGEMVTTSMLRKYGLIK